MFACLPIAIFAVVVGADWMKTMGVAVAAHVMDLRQLLGLGAHLGALSLALAFIATVGVWVDVLVAVVSFPTATVRALICADITSNWVSFACVLAAWSLLAAAALAI